MLFTSLKRALPLALCALLATAAGAAPALMKAGMFSPAREAPDFALRGSDGAALSLGAYRGKVVALVFGFTNCAAVCPTTLAVLAQARAKLGPAAAKQVQVVFITVDPERDSTERMRGYLAAFDRGFIGGSGRTEELASVRKHYGVTAEKVKMGDSYAMNHSSSVYLIDAAGKLRAMMPYGHAADDYVHDIQWLLDNKL